MAKVLLLSEVVDEVGEGVGLGTGVGVFVGVGVEVGVGFGVCVGAGETVTVGLGDGELPGLVLGGVEGEGIGPFCPGWPQVSVGGLAVGVAWLMVRVGVELTVWLGLFDGSRPLC